MAYNIQLSVVFGVKGVKEVKGVKDNSFAMDFNPETTAFHGKSFVINSKTNDNIT